MERVRRHAEADDLAQDRGSTGARGIERLQHQHGGAFAQDQAAAVLRKRTAGVGRDHAHGLPRFEESETEDGFASAGDGHGRGAAPHHPKSLSDGVIGRRAGGGNGIGGPHHAGLERDAAGGGVFHGARNGERIHARDVVAIKIDEALVFGGLAADAGAGDDGGGLAQFLGPLDAGRGDGLARRDYAELRETIEQTDFFFVEVLAKARNFGPRRRWRNAAARGSTACSGAMPERPAWSDCQNSPLLLPIAEMTPRPVTATRWRHVRR